MEAYLWFHVIMGVVGLVIRAGYVSWHEYPRVTETSRGWDVFLLLLGLSVTLWAAWLLFVAR